MRSHVSIPAVLLIILLFAALTVSAKDVEPAAKRFNFTNVSASAGIQGDPAAGGHGVAFGDIDGDGDLDIYISNTPGTGSFRNYLYVNQGNDKFTEEAIKRGVESDDRGSHGVAFVDFDNDGDLDLFVANAGGDNQPGQNRVYENDGTGYFDDATGRSEMKNKLFITRGAAIGDFTGDGILDVIISNPIQTFGETKSVLNINRFFRGEGNWKFKLQSSGLTFSGFTQGVAVGDIDGDGDLDFVESKWPAYDANGLSGHIWLNTGNGNFTDVGDLAGDGFYRDSYRHNGAALGDSDNDGDLDMVVVGDSLRFFVNDGDGTFTEQTALSGLSGEGFTAAFGDLDLDGRQEIVVAYRNVTETFVVFQNRGGNNFARQSNVGVAPPNYNDPRGMSLGDYDNDGDLDIMVAHKKGVAELFRNNRNKPKNYLKLRLTSPAGEAGAIGTKVFVYSAGKLGDSNSLLAYREVGGVTGYVSQNSPEVHIGLKKRKAAVDILVRFLDGTEVKFEKILPGRTITLGFD